MDEGSHTYSLKLAPVIKRRCVSNFFGPISLRPRKQNLFTQDKRGYEHVASLIVGGKNISDPITNLDSITETYCYVETPKSGYSFYANNSTSTENEKQYHNAYLCLASVPLIPNFDDTERTCCIKLKPRKRLFRDTLGDNLVFELTN